MRVNESVVDNYLIYGDLHIDNTRDFNIKLNVKDGDIMDYGIFHGVGLGINDAWLRKKKTINKERKKAGLKPLPENKWTKALGIFITFNTVMLSFLIFSGFLNDLWFTKK